MDHIPVVICGGGIVGRGAAIGFKQRGIDCLVFEKCSNFVYDSSVYSYERSY